MAIVCREKHTYLLDGSGVMKEVDWITFQKIQKEEERKNITPLLQALQKKGDNNGS